jgi:hypothetical protein
VRVRRPAVDVDHCGIAGEVGLSEQSEVVFGCGRAVTLAASDVIRGLVVGPAQIGGRNGFGRLNWAQRFAEIFIIDPSPL